MNEGKKEKWWSSSGIRNKNNKVTTYSRVDEEKLKNRKKKIKKEKEDRRNINYQSLYGWSEFNQYSHLVINYTS